MYLYLHGVRTQFDFLYRRSNVTRTIGFGVQRFEREFFEKHRNRLLLEKYIDVCVSL